MNYHQRQMIKEAYKEGYESALNENVFKFIRRLLGMGDDVPPRAPGVRQNPQKELARPIRDTSTGDVIVPGTGSQKIGNPDTSAPPPQSIDDVIGDQPVDTRKARYRNPVRLSPDEIDDLADRVRKLADDDLDTPIG